jgi:hypothetical protein
MTVISRKLYIKPGCIRSVHINTNGSANWVVKHNGTLVNVSGFVQDMNFISNEKYKHIIDAYVPQRVNRKKNNVTVNIAEKLSADCLYMGQKRRVQYQGSREQGIIYWKGERIKVKVINGIARKV